MLMKDLLIILSVSLFIVTLVSAVCPSIRSSDALHRQRRQLLFPNATLLQFNAGIGTPTPIKSIMFNWAFQANFNMPWNRSQIPLDLLQANSGYDGLSRKKRDGDAPVGDGEVQSYYDKYQDETMLYHLYKYGEDILDGMGQNGSSCVHRTLCELGAAPIQSDDEQDLLQELAAFLFNPTNGPSPNNPEEKKGLQTYIESYRFGESSSPEDCVLRYECSAPILDILTELEKNDAR